MIHQSALVRSLACLFAFISIMALHANAAETSDWASLELGYAEANLELAQARLDLATSQKQAVADSVSDDTLDALEAGVLSAQNCLAQLKTKTAAGANASQILAAEQELQGLKAAYTKSLEANKLAAGSVSDLELRSQLAEVNVAKARLAAARELGNQPVEVRMQWQIGQLQDQIRALWARPLIED